jgi:hypothetical protein
MLRYISIGATVAVVVALVGFLLGTWFPRMPAPVLAVTLFLCPSQVFFVATAACEPFDACSLNMLGWVVAANVLLYSALAGFAWLTRQRWKVARLGVFTAVGAASAWWVTQWV